jgi:metal-sulfur cluster biosynthetic enzyme
MKTCTDKLSPVETQMRAALSRVIDPEIGENLVELGLVYGIEADGKRASVQLTLTSPACPMGEMVLDDAYAALCDALPKEMEIDIEMVWEPPWDPAMISAAAKQRLGWN